MNETLRWTRSTLAPFALVRLYSLVPHLLPVALIIPVATICTEPFLWHVCRGGLTTRFSSLSTGIFIMTPLRQRFIEDLQLRNYAPKTIVAYVHQVRGLAHHFKLSPDRLGDDQIRHYLLHLLHDKHAAETSYNQAVAALHSSMRYPLPVARLSGGSPTVSRANACRTYARSKR